MKINLNIIKILLLVFSFSSVSNAGNWVGTCGSCGGCLGIQTIIVTAATTIDNKHGQLERDIAKIYKEKIIDANIIKINKIQEGITKSVAHIRELGHAADIESKELIFILRKNKALYSLPTGVE